MAHFLYKPHVTGPENNITTPDLLIDRAVVHVDGDRHYLPVHRLCADAEMQVIDGAMTATPAYALIGAGGGALISMAAILKSKGHPLLAADVVVARAAWRLRNLADHVGNLQLLIDSGAEAESVSLSTAEQPGDFLRKSDDGEPVCPRGVIGIFAATRAAVTATSPAQLRIRLSDDALERNLSHSLGLIPVSADRWAERPLPRYAVGPVGDVQHYI